MISYKLDWAVMLAAGKHFKYYDKQTRRCDVNVELYTPQLYTSVRIRHTKKREIKAEPAFPGYYFARGDVKGLLQRSWIGAKPLVVNNKIQTIDCCEMDRVAAMERASAVSAAKGVNNHVTFYSGEKVIVDTGLCKGLTCMVESQEGSAVTVTPLFSNVAFTVHCATLARCTTI